MIVCLQTFTGNWNIVSVFTNFFYPPIVARKIRVHPKTWNENYIKMRVEYLGCYHGAYPEVINSGWIMFCDYQNYHCSQVISRAEGENSIAGFNKSFIAYFSVKNKII